MKRSVLRRTGASMGMLLTALLMLPASASADELVATIAGSRSGPFPSERSRNPGVPLVTLKYEGGSVPGATGETRSTMPTLKPATITKVIGAASPRIMKAMLDREPLMITIEVFAPSTAGMILVHRVRFEGAQILSVERNANVAAASPFANSMSSRDAPASSMTESLTFNYQTVVLDAGTPAELPVQLSE